VPWAIDGSNLVDPEDACFVAVEGQRLTVALEVPPRGLEVRERRLGGREAYEHQAAGGVIDVHQRRAHRCPILKPTMFATIDLDQLSETGSTSAWLLNPRPTQLAGQPQARGDLELSDSLLGNHDVVSVTELLGRQRRAEVRVLGAQDLQDLLGDGALQAPIATSVAVPGDQAQPGIGSPVVRSAERSSQDAQPLGPASVPDR